MAAFGEGADRTVLSVLINQAMAFGVGKAQVHVLWRLNLICVPMGCWFGAWLIWWPLVDMNYFRC